MSRVSSLVEGLTLTFCALEGVHWRAQDCRGDGGDGEPRAGQPGFPAWALDYLVAAARSDDEARLARVCYRVLPAMVRQGLMAA